jgi:hypothetical protein
LNTKGQLAGYTHLVGGVRIGQVRVKPELDSNCPTQEQFIARTTEFECYNRFGGYDNDRLARYCLFLLL